MLLFGFLCKGIGASWDASFHFKHLREFYQLPHLLNGFGDLVVVFLLFYLWKREPKGERRDLKIILYGIIFFILSIFFDQWWHARFGIDLTTWSLAHFFLYLGTLIALIGTTLYVARDYKHGKISPRTKLIYSLFFFFLILDSFWFPLLQQEQGVIASYKMGNGINFADPELYNAFMASNLSVYGGVPDWVYGAWAVFSLVVVFSLAKRLNIHKFSATIIAVQYVFFRFVMNNIFISILYPTSTVPYFIIPIALIFDLIYNAEKDNVLIKNLLPATFTILGVSALGLFSSVYPFHPPIPLETLAYSIVGAVLAYPFVLILYKKVFEQHL